MTRTVQPFNRLWSRPAFNMNGGLFEYRELSGPGRLPAM